VVLVRREGVGQVPGSPLMARSKTLAGGLIRAEACGPSWNAAPAQPNDDALAHTRRPAMRRPPLARHALIVA
jgi:hypothetical protein